MTRITTIIALTCFLVFGATAATILGRDSIPGRDSVPGVRLELAAVSPSQSPVSNKAAKQDKLTVAATFALASFGAAAGRHPERTAAPGLCRRRSRRPRAAAGRRSAGAAEAEGRRQTAAPGSKARRAAQRLADRRYQGTAPAFFVTGIVLAGGGDRIARRRSQDPRDAARPIPWVRRSIRTPRSSAAQIGGDAACSSCARTRSAKCARSPASSAWKKSRQ